jgi:hypothetical protein
MLTVMDILKRSPAQSSQIVEKLIKINKISPATARKRLSRSKNLVQRLDTINLPNREKIYYLPDQYGSNFFFEMVSKILIKNNTAAGRGIIALSGKEGVLPLALFPKASGTPFVRIRKQLNSRDVVSQLESSGLISIKQDDTHGKLLCRYDCADLSARKRAAIEVENVFLSIIKSWVANLSMSSFGALKIRDDVMPAYGAYNWDLVGPCYLNGLATFSGDSYKHAFIVADIIFDKIITQKDIMPFLFKVNSLNNQKRIRPFLAIFIADMFSSDALRELRKKGIIIARPDTILGKENAELVKSLISTLEDASKKLAKNPDDIFTLLKNISKIEGASLNLRSVVLDFILARIYALEGYDCDIRQKIQLNSGIRAEIDVIASRKDKLVFVEGKALSPNNQFNNDGIQKWMNNTYPKIKEFVKQKGKLPSEISIELCVSTSYHNDSIDIIKELEKRHTKLPIKFTDGTEVMKRLRRFEQGSVIDLFREHFTQK